MNEFIPRSCLDYLQHGKHENDFYWLYDDQDKLYVAYCDLSYEPGSAWTLVASWATAKFRELPHFKTKPFPVNSPLNENTPNWNAFRQTRDRMYSVRKRSTHWRATCDINRLQTIDYQDYLRGKFSDFDIMSWLGGRTCWPVEYVNILGNTGVSGIIVGFWQKDGAYFLHTDSSNTTCEFIAEATPLVDYFGYYKDGLSYNFRCSRYDTSTTQWWFGGYLQED